VRARAIHTDNQREGERERDQGERLETRDQKKKKKQRLIVHFGIVHGGMKERKRWWGGGMTQDKPARAHKSERSIAHET